MGIISRYLMALVLALCASLSFAHGEQKHHDMTPPDSLAISVTFDQTGRLWRVSVNDGFVEVSNSTDLGKTFSSLVRVNPVKQKITAHGEVRPKVAIGKQGEVYVTWMQNLPARFSGYIWFARSVDGGKSFEKPYVVHHDRTEISHAFEELKVSPDGKILVLWLDARDLVRAKQAGKSHEGSSIYYATSSDSGKSFNQEKKLADHTCECCRLASAIKPDGTVAVMWRHVFAGSERDHAIAEINSDKAPAIVRASYGRWKIDGCPHHGAALAYGEGFGYYMAFFDGAGDKPSLMVARMDGEAWVSSPPRKFGNMKNSAGHPALLSLGEKVWLVWKETNTAKATEVYQMKSDDGGKSWDDAKLIFTTKDKADYPQLIENKGKVSLAINTAADGFKLMPISGN
jgi:hypothetical protein